METEEIRLLRQQHEYEEVYTFVFEKNPRIEFAPGQYVHMKLPTVEAPHKSVRELSFASAPSDPELWFTVNTRSGSPFQHALRALQPGDPALLFKIKGDLALPVSGHAVLISAGVGAAPFRSLIRSRTELPITTIQVGRDAFLYQEEWSTLSFEQIRINRSELGLTLDDAVSKYPDAHYLIAGAPEFVHIVAAHLEAKNIPIDMIQSDEFKGLEDSE